MLDPLLRIGEVARRCGVSTRTLRYYEEMGLLTPADTSEGGFRLYAPDVVERVDRIGRLKEVMGFTLEEIRSTLVADDRVKALWSEHQHGDPAARLAVVDEYIGALEAQHELVRAKRDRLDAVRAELDDALARARGRRAELIEAATTAGTVVAASGEAP